MNNAGDPAEAARQARPTATAPFDNKAAEHEHRLDRLGLGRQDGRLRQQRPARRSCRPPVSSRATINRWTWLQELAMSNDLLLQNPAMWPKAEPGDDIAGSQPLRVLGREGQRQFVNLSAELGLDVPHPDPGRGGRRHQRRRRPGLRRRPAVGRHRPTTATTMPGNGRLPRSAAVPAGRRRGRPAPVGGRVGTPAYGAGAPITTADGHTQIAQLDGGGGHSGKRSFDVFFGLGVSRRQAGVGRAVLAGPGPAPCSSQTLRSDRRLARPHADQPSPGGAGAMTDVQQVRRPSAADGPEGTAPPADAAGRRPAARKAVHRAWTAPTRATWRCATSPSR